MRLLIKDVYMVDAFNSRFGSLLIEEGKIRRILEAGKSENLLVEQRLTAEGALRVIEGRGLTLMPAFVDIHCHLRTPGYEYKEDLESGQLAALKGGYTTLVAMANTKPVCDNRDILEEVLKKSDKLDLCDVYQVAAITKGLEGKELVSYEEFLPLTTIFSDDGNTIFDEKLMKKALEASKNLGFKILVHAQPEFQVIERDIALVKELGGSLHFCHISKEKSLQIISEAKAMGINVSCEVAPHHIFAYGLDYRVNPSFRREEDVEALLQGIREGAIDMIATDHAPHSHEDKEKGAPGISSIEVAFSMVNSVFQENAIPINTLSRMMSYEPSKFLGIKNGLIEEDYEGNLVLVDLEEEYSIKTRDFVSKGKNNPFEGAKVRGRVKITIKRGRVMFTSLDS